MSEDKKEIVQESEVQGQPREELLRLTEQHIYRLFELNEITYLEWQNMLSNIDFDMRKHCKVSLPKI